MTTAGGAASGTNEVISFKQKVNTPEIEKNTPFNSRKFQSKEYTSLQLGSVLIGQNNRNNNLYLSRICPNQSSNILGIMRYIPPNIKVCMATNDKERDKCQCNLLKNKENENNLQLLSDNCINTLNTNGICFDSARMPLSSLNIFINENELILSIFIRESTAEVCAKLPTEKSMLISGAEEALIAFEDKKWKGLYLKIDENDIKEEIEDNDNNNNNDCFAFGFGYYYNGRLPNVVDCAMIMINKHVSKTRFSFWIPSGNTMLYDKIDSLKIVYHEKMKGFKYEDKILWKWKKSMTNRVDDQYDIIGNFINNNNINGNYFCINSCVGWVISKYKELELKYTINDCCLMRIMLVDSLVSKGNRCGDIMRNVGNQLWDEFLTHFIKLDDSGKYKLINSVINTNGIIAGIDMILRIFSYNYYVDNNNNHNNIVWGWCCNYLTQKFLFEHTGQSGININTLIDIIGDACDNCIKYSNDIFLSKLLNFFKQLQYNQNLQSSSSIIKYQNKFIERIFLQTQIIHYTCHFAHYFPNTINVMSNIATKIHKNLNLINNNINNINSSNNNINNNNFMVNCFFNKGIRRGLKCNLNLREHIIYSKVVKPEYNGLTPLNILLNKINEIEKGLSNDIMLIQNYNNYKRWMNGFREYLF